MSDQEKKTEAPEAASTQFGMPLHTPAPSTPASGTIKIATPLPTPAANLPAMLLERYEVAGEAGSGGIGIVFKARDRETGEWVALKILRPEVAADLSIFDRFLNEMRLARKITHKNVCRIYDLTRANGSAYISMEFVEGESLRHVLGRFGTLSVRKGLQIAREICAGLREAHAQGVVHRDLKPENIMLDHSGHVKIMDFGIARSTDTHVTHHGSVIGTPAYMAPEQAEGKPADARADIYALGLILYEMFTGRPAFTGDTPVAIAVKQIHATPARPRALEPALSPHLEAVILKCLEKDLATRFQSVDELEQALEASEAGLRRTLPPQRVAAFGAVAAAMLIAFSLGWQMKPETHPAEPAPQQTTIQSPVRTAQQAQAAPLKSSPLENSAAKPEPSGTAEKQQATPPKPAVETARYNFHLTEAPEFTAVGPIAIRLNDADPKRQMYTFTVEMGGNRMEMRNRTLLEPVRFYHDPSRRMLEVVVSKIEGNQVQGYLVAPKSLKPFSKPGGGGSASPNRKPPLIARLFGR